MSRSVIVAAGQIACKLADVAANTLACEATLTDAADHGASLLVLPECALSGYVFDDLQTARRAAVSLNGPEIRQLAEHCARLGVYCVVGFLELQNDAVYNSAALLGPTGVVGSYRKAHLPYLGVDRCTTRGNTVEPPVFDTDIGRIGLAICYDLRFPESARTLALSGADIIAQPSNWPPEAWMLAEHFTRVRACENRVFLIIANRSDVERGVQFMGQSQIVDPTGDVLARAGTEQGCIYASVDVDLARDKQIVVEPGVYQVSLFEDRRPDLYGPITATLHHSSHTLVEEATHVRS